MKLGRDEVQCLKCDGAGLIHNDSAEWSWRVSLCPTCNGAGVVIVIDKKPVAFDVDKRMLPEAVRGQVTGTIVCRRQA